MAFLTHEEATDLAGPTVRLAVMVFIECTGTPIRAWSGVGDLPIAGDAVDVDGGVYTGLGELTGLPAVSQLINGLAERIEIQLSGVPAEVIALADAESDSVKNAAFHLGFAGMGPDWQLVGGTFWLWEGEVDTPRLGWASEIGDDGSAVQTRTVSLSIGSAMTGRRRPRLGYYSGVDQRRRSSDDAFCDRAGGYSAGSTRKWP